MTLLNFQAISYIIHSKTNNNKNNTLSIQGDSVSLQYITRYQEKPVF